MADMVSQGGAIVGEVPEVVEEGGEEGVPARKEVT